MRSLLLSSAFLITGSLGAGCVVVDRHPRASFVTPTCHPSQYWDGQQCRHKGKGHGARKHDGAPGPGQGNGNGKGKGKKG